MRRRAPLLLTVLTLCFWLHTTAPGAETPRPPKSSADAIEIRLLDAEGKVVAQRASRPEELLADVRLKRAYAKGDRILIQGPSPMKVSLGNPMPEAIVFCPDGLFEFAIPFGPAARAYAPAKTDSHHITAAAASKADLAQYRNLALNPYASLDKPASFPHASSNSVCRGEPVFAARNAIDGISQPKGHGSWPHQSWGPDQKGGLVWRLDFGREVEIDRLVLVLRADLPHDKFFTAVTLLTSDDSRTDLKLKPTGDRQEFPFPARKITWLELRDWAMPNPPGWCAVTEIEAWGRDASDYQKKATWREALLTQLATGPSTAIARAIQDFPESRQELDIVADWALQDKLEGPGSESRLQAALSSILAALGPAAADLRAQCDALDKAQAPASDPRRAELYLAACELRRAARLAPHADKLRRIVFTRHYDLGGSHYAYTEGQSDAQAERHFSPPAALCLLELDLPVEAASSRSPTRQDAASTRIRTLIDDPRGVIRDPDVSYDGTRILFAWKRSLNDDDYHLYELNLLDGSLRQLTFGLGFADYEPAYLPNGDIVFNSTRCVQSVDCWWTEVSNLYTCDRDGRYLRRLSYDQVHTNFPTVTPDGRVIYTRWDYSDRGQIYPQGLFEMHPDGTGQTALYGNNTWFPTSILHARAIPGTRKFISIFSGHHCIQKGWLGILDPLRGRQENAGAQLIAPVRETKAVRVDAYAQTGDQFQYPYPLNEREYLVTFRPAQTGGATAGLSSRAQRFGIYYMDIDGHRELLASDPRISCNQPIPVAPRPLPHVRPSTVDYTSDTGTVYLQDIYRGPGLAGIPRGTIRNLRVIAIDFRAAAIGSNGNSGPAGGAMASTPISIQGAWDPKRILGTARVYDDGSACFTVPARTPIYFQALDERGHAVQTMRSWATLQPGEHVSCVGCHDNKNTTPPVAAPSLALQAGAQSLTPWVPTPLAGSNVATRGPRVALDSPPVATRGSRVGTPVPDVATRGPRVALDSPPVATRGSRAVPPALDLAARGSRAGLLATQEGGQSQLPPGFSFIREIQPILDRHCVRCHNQDAVVPPTAVSRGTFDPKTMRLLVPTEGATWRYAEKYPGDDWFRPRGDDSKWATGPGGFGVYVPGGRVGTRWRSPDIWLRRTFDLPADAKLCAPALLAHHDDDMEVYLNGELAAAAEGFTIRYEVFPIRPYAAATLKPGKNLLAVRAWAKGGGQYIDVGLVNLLTCAEPAAPAYGVASSPSSPSSPSYPDNRKPTTDNLAPSSPLASDIKPAFSLKGTQTLEPAACRKWSDAYKALANRRYCNWINIQSEPTLLPPYHAGAARSRLITILEAGHYGVRLAPDDLDRIATWIDLLVPYCGDYTEAMNEPSIPRYQHFANKRKRMEALEARNIADLLTALRDGR